MFGIAPIDENTAPSYIEKLHEQGKIDALQTTLWLNKKDKQSLITFGGIPPHSIKDYSYKTHTLRSVYDKFWQEDVWMIPLSDYSYGDKSIK